MFRMTEAQILEAIVEERMFATMEVDISVPENLKSYFEEMTPVFKHASVSLNDIGKHMNDFLETTKTPYKDRDYLIGSMFATKILLISPLIKWYLDHGLVVTKIHQIIEFSPRRCFREFVNSVSDDRRGGDKHQSLKVIADTSKLLGSSILNLFAHKSNFKCSVLYK